MKCQQNANRKGLYSVRKEMVRGEVKWRVAFSTKVLAGKRVRLFRDTKEEAVAAANEYLEENQIHGSELASLTVVERGLILWLRERGMTVEAAQKILAEAPSAVGPVMAKGVLEYLKSQEGNSDAHLYSLRSKFTRIEAAFTGRRVGTIRPGEVELFLRDKGRSKLAYYRVLRAFFNFAVMHDWTVANPILKIPRPSMAPDERIIFTPEEMKRLLVAAQRVGSLPMLRLLVLGGFFGLRYKEILNLQVGDVGKMEIHVQKMKTQKKGMRERYVTALPNAKAWLKLLELPEEGQVLGVNDKNLRLHREKVLEEASKGSEPITWPYNVLRRSFGSYHLAAFEDPGKTATQMGHTDPETTVGKYRSVRTKAAGKKWFAIRPEKATS